MSTEEDPIVALNFYLEIDNQTIATFKECSGIEVEVEVIEHREVNAKGQSIIKKIPGANKYTPITLKRGQTTSRKLFDSFALALSPQNIGGKRAGGFKRGGGSITIKDVTGATDSVKYVFDRCWISKYKCGELNASGNGVTLEEVTIVHEGLHREM